MLQKGLQATKVIALGDAVVHQFDARRREIGRDHEEVWDIQRTTAEQFEHLSPVDEPFVRLDEQCVRAFGEHEIERLIRVSGCSDDLDWAEVVQRIRHEIPKQRMPMQNDRS